MAHRHSQGFTIIETTLVMAIVGLLAASVMVGIGSSLNHQRYTDAVTQAVAFFRNQYSQTINTQNDRVAKAQRCSPSGVAAAPTGANAADVYPGGSDCLLLGNILHSTDGKKISVYQVIGLNDPTDDASAVNKTDTAILSGVNLRQGNLVSDYSLEWGTGLQRPGGSTPAAFSVMVVRVPVSGTVVTYSANSGGSTPSALLAATQSDLKLCIDQTGFFGVGVKPAGVIIKKAAANTAGVQQIASGDCV